MERWKRRLMDVRIVHYQLILIFLQSSFPTGNSRKSGNFFLNLTGNDGSFAQLTDWQPLFSSSSNWTLSFDFRTNISSGLLLYADDNSKRSFIQLRLLSSQLECRVQTPFSTFSNQSISGGSPSPASMVAKLGHDLNDNQWHTILMDKAANVVSVRVQSISLGEEVKKRLVLSVGRVFDGPAKMFLGGLPEKLSSHFSELANPSVVFESRWKGFVRSVFYGSDFHGNWMELLPGAGATAETIPALCDSDQLDRDIIFSGKEFIHFSDFPASLDSVVMPENEMDTRFFFQFRSRLAHGALTKLHWGLHFAVTVILSENAVVITVITPTGSRKTTCRNEIMPNFRDFSLHNMSLELRKNSTKLLISLDGADPCWTVTLPQKEEPKVLGFTEVYVGNFPVSGDGENGPGFQGSVSKLTLRSNHWTKNLHDATQRSASSAVFPIQQPADVGPSGVMYRCEEEKSGHAHIEFQFCNPSIFLTVPGPESHKLRTVSFRMRTMEPSGLLFFHRHVERDTFTVVDLFEGSVNVFVHRSEIASANADSPRITIPSSRIDDGKWHNLTLSVTISTGTGAVSLDDAETEFVIRVPSSVRKLNAAKSEMYFGGAPQNDTAKRPELWSVQSEQSFRGVIKDIRINTDPLEDEVIARWNDETCPTMRTSETRYCAPNPCFHAGTCREGWQRFLCDCLTTGYGGERCEKDLKKMDFNETFLLSYPVPSSERQVSDVIFRLQTNQTDSQLLRASECPETTSPKDKRIGRVLSVSIRNCRLIVRLSLMTSPLDDPTICEWEVASNVTDFQWHTVTVTRRGPHVRITVDEETIAESISALEGVSLSFCRLEIGGTSLPSVADKSDRHKRGKSGQRSHPSKKDRLLRSIPPQSPPFRGSIQGLMFDGRNVFESGDITSLPIRKISEEERLNITTAFFQTAAGFLELETLNADVRFHITFAFRTGEMNGLILFNGKPGKDFVAIELVRGNVCFSFDLGNGAQTIMTSQSRPLNDKIWHEVEVKRAKPAEFSLTVDEAVYQTANPDRVKSKLDLSGKLYLGGIPKSDFVLLPRSVVSRHGFTGCLRELRLNQVRPDLAEIARQQPRSTVVPGCAEAVEGCQADSCHHGGLCEHTGNGVLCDCDTTSYSGPTCNDLSVSYRFGPVPSLIIYHFDPAERLDSRNDQIAFGLITLEREAILGRVASFTSNDVIEFEIVDGHLFVIYNMGKKAHVISDLKHRLNDGQYHVVRFNRTGANAAIQIDDYAMLSNNPVGPQLDIFNGISTVEIGGKLNANDQGIERAFTGIISGFVLNGIRILDLVADNDSNIITDGSLELVTDLSMLETQRKISISWLDEMQHIDTTRSHETTTPDNDDIIIATTPRCREDDESCVLIDSSKSDDLIFAHYTVVKPTTVRPKPVSSTAAPVIVSNVPCDDEDCDTESSGDDSLLSARAAVARTTRIFNVSFNTTTMPPLTEIPTQSSNGQGPAVPPGTLSTGAGPRFGGGHPRSGLVPAPTGVSRDPATDAASVLVEYAAIIAGTAIGVILLVGIIVFLAVRFRGRRTAAQRNGHMGKPTAIAPKKAETPSGTVGRSGRSSVGQGTLRSNPRHSEVTVGEEDGSRPYGDLSGWGKTGKDKECYV